jgi:hypothetical protein
MRARTVIALIIVAPGAIVLGTLVTFLMTGLLIASAGPAPHAASQPHLIPRLHDAHLTHRGHRRPSR